MTEVSIDFLLAVVGRQTIEIEQLKSHLQQAQKNIAALTAKIGEMQHASDDAEVDGVTNGKR